MLFNNKNQQRFYNNNELVEEFALNRIIKPAPFFGATLLLAALTFTPILANAVSLSVDLDPGTPGVQSTRNVAPGANFDVDILISDVANLNVYEFDLDFGSILQATGVTSGGFLPAPLFLPPEVIEADIAAPDVNFTETVIGPGGATGSGRLATIGFFASTTGVTTLTLNDVVLLAPFAGPIPQPSLNNATVTISAPTGTVPEPESFLLFAAGLLGVLIRRRTSCKAATRFSFMHKTLG